MIETTADKTNREETPADQVAERSPAADFASSNELARTEALIVGFIRDELGETDVDSVEPNDNLLTSGLVDSVGVLRLIGYLESRLEVKVPPGELVPENFRTVRVMAGFMLGLRDG